MWLLDTAARAWVSPWKTLARRVKASTAVAGLRTDFTFLNASRARSEFIPSPTCDACGAPYETHAHFLLACPAWEHLRPPLYQASMAAGSFGTLYLPTLLNDPLLLKHIAKFVEQTGRFI
ncbi:hypothetical protein C8J57DRAFT_1661306 [Mycena rebaudengoi]|nr:hypothetical protein C8J57DRAFT_1661306 [Mycena rebaudengoi]